MTVAQTGAPPGAQTSAWTGPGRGGITRRHALAGLAGLCAASALPAPLRAQDAPPLLLAGARIFDGRAPRLIEGQDVLVRGDRIEALVARDQGPAEARTLDCSGLTLMPGLIDAHWHSILAALPMTVAWTADIGYIHLLAAQEAERTLLRGFTTVRDVGGPAFALKRAIDEGRFAGPRIYPSGAMITQTGGHGDFRLRAEIPRGPLTPLSAAEIAGISAIADGAPEMLRRSREQLLLGASQIKLMVGGGVSSQYDPLDVQQFTQDEIRAAVQAARDWGTYVAAHVYTSQGILRALDCGVLSIEHGQLADDRTAARIAEAGAWWSLQPFLADADANPQPTPEQQAQQREIAEGTVRALEFVRAHEVKTAIGTDILFSPGRTWTQGRQIAKLAAFMPAAEVLRLATSANAELLALSGERNPYPGKLGVVEPGAIADLIALDGDPLVEIGLIGDPDRSMPLIVKGGAIVRDARASAGEAAR